VSTTSDVIIVGAGITGCAAAHELASRGVEVRVLDGRDIGTMGSGRTLAGVRQSGRHPAELPLAIEAVRRWEKLGDELGADVEYRQRGNLRLAEDENDAELIKAMVEDQVLSGLDIRFLDGNDAVRSVAPALSHHLEAAAFTPSDGHSNPLRTVQAYASAAQRNGAMFETGNQVSSLQVEHGRVTGVVANQNTYSADCVVVAAGIETPAILQTAGLNLPLSLAMVPVVQTVETSPLLDQVLGTAKAHFAARQETDGRLRFSSGGRPIELSTEDLTDSQMQPGCARLADTLSRATSIIPALQEIPVNRVWGGLIDLTPDGIPVIDRLEDPAGLIVAAGYSGHGFCLGPVSGEIIRDLVLGQPSGFRLEPFKWDRLLVTHQVGKPELLG
jgi:sarcosine oxidase, subunit beta